MHKARRLCRTLRLRRMDCEGAVAVIDTLDHSTTTWGRAHGAGRSDVHRNDALTVSRRIRSRRRTCASRPGRVRRKRGVSIEMIRESPGKIPVFGRGSGHQSIPRIRGRGSRAPATDGRQTSPIEPGRSRRVRGVPNLRGGTAITRESEGCVAPEGTHRHGGTAEGEIRVCATRSRCRGCSSIGERAAAQGPR